MENGDISMFPEEMYKAFSSKNILVTPSLLNTLIKSDKINLPDYDIYAMGKKKRNKKKYYWTKLRIMKREHSRNCIQGYLSVSFLSGYGFEKNNRDKSNRIMRPTAIGKMVSDDDAVFKKRAMIDINGTFLSLQSAEGFCNIPLLSTKQMKSDKSLNDSLLNSKKRKAYATYQISRKKWAHINRKAMGKDQKKSLHSMLLPYKKNLSDKEYFPQFISDIVKNCSLLKKEFECEQEINMDVFKSIEPRKMEEKVTLTKIKGKEINNLKNIPTDKIEW